MRNINFRTLRADEIEVRPQSVSNGKATMLLYIDSRAVVSLLDETVGNMNWQSEFYEANGQTFGKIGIYDEDRNIWIWKSDVGSESNVEAEKGKISDTYKRVMSRWGVQELYSAPRIVIPDDGYKNVGYKVSYIEYDDNRNIIALTIVNKFGKEAFNWVKGMDVPQTPKTISNTPKTAINNNNRQTLTEFCSQKKAEGVDKDQLKKFYDTYIGKCDSWDGKFMVDRLWKYWDKAA